MKTALILLDYINDIIHPNGKIAASAKFVEEHNVINHTNELIHWARKKGIIIIFVNVGFEEDYADCSDNSPIFSHVKHLQALKLNTWGTELHEEIDIKKTDILLIKYRISAFYGTSLSDILVSNHITNLLIAGISTDMAVQSTVREAHDRDYNVTVVSDACGASSIENHENTLCLLKKVAVVTSTDVITTAKENC